MNRKWVQYEWEDLCDRLRRSAESGANVAQTKTDEIQRQVDEFCRKKSPERYPDLLLRVQLASQLASCWNQMSDFNAAPVDVEIAGGREQFDLIDEAGIESFPTSDPPVWTTAAI